MRHKKLEKKLFEIEKRIVGDVQEAIDLGVPSMHMVGFLDGVKFKIHEQAFKSVND